MQLHSEAAQVVTIQICICEMTASNLGQETNHPARVFLAFVAAVGKMPRGEKLGYGLLYRYECSFPPITRYCAFSVADTVVNNLKELNQTVYYGIFLHLFRPPVL
jgi:hypothetical protein